MIVYPHHHPHHQHPFYFWNIPLGDSCLEQWINIDHPTLHVSHRHLSFLKASTVSGHLHEASHRCLNRCGPWNLEVATVEDGAQEEPNATLGVSSRRANIRNVWNNQVRWWKMRTRKKLYKMFLLLLDLCLYDFKRRCEKALCGKGEGKLSKSQKPGAKCMGLG